MELLNRLIARGLVKEDKAESLLKTYRDSGKDLIDLIIDMGLCSDEEIASFLSKEVQIPYVDVDKFIIDPTVAILISEDVARQYKLIPLFKIKDVLTVAMSNPMDLKAIDAVAKVAKCHIEPVFAPRKDILKRIEEQYKVGNSLDKILEVIGEEDTPEERLDIQSIQKAAEEAPLIKLVNLIILRAIEEKASDIHIEPARDSVKVRYRIDGVLHVIENLPRHLKLPIASRLKLIANLDIVERWKPQDGRISLKFKGREIDLRVSVFPTTLGEKIVMRILDKSRALASLEKLGFLGDELKAYRELIRRPYGIILITGPTGSGKTSSLYASLCDILSPEINITTLEDPVEYIIDGITQGQVDFKHGFDFAEGLRSILRQDPNVILVGEIRDGETAQIAIRSSLTGHLVFSTLHTNDAPSAVSRLLDMGVDPFLVATSLICVLAQRLLRLICPNCKVEYNPGPGMKELFDQVHMQAPEVFYRGQGCAQCHFSGYAGRSGIFELLVVNEGIRPLILGRKSTDDLRAQAKLGGMKTLRESALEKVRLGLTTVEEALRVT